MYMAVFALALAFTACGSDDDNFDCNEGNTVLADTLLAYQETNSTDTCNAYRIAIENIIINNCSEDEEVIKGLQQELDQLGDCTFAGRTCLSCTNSGITLQVCRGENGNAFIEEKDTGVPFTRYVELSKCE